MTQNEPEVRGQKSEVNQSESLPRTSELACRSEIALSGRLPARLIRELIDHSYDLVVRSLPAKAREALDRK